jgi:tRNA pseudouridine55 synthase
MTTLPTEDNYIEPDILLVHKPKGITSFDVIRKLRRVLTIRKIGHAGTLDPLAHGLMIVGIQSGTKKMQQYLKLPKTYTAEVLCGMSTATGDLEGETIEEKSIVTVDFKEKHIQEALDSMVGEHQLQAPLYSALKVEGKPLYWYARNNQTPPFIPVKEMNVTSIMLLDNYVSGKYYVIKIRIEVSSGTYIRTLGEELGKRLGYPATLKGLYRVKIGVHEDQHAFRLPDGV